MSAATPVVADTHALVWYLDADARLSAGARTAFDDATAADLPIYVATITLLELHYLAVRGKVPTDAPQHLSALLNAPDSAFEAYPLDTDVASAAAAAPWRLGDPADRIIAGTAYVLRLPLVTRDRHLTDSGYITALW